MCGACVGQSLVIYDVCTHVYRLHNSVTDHELHSIQQVVLIVGRNCVQQQNANFVAHHVLVTCHIGLSWLKRRSDLIFFSGHLGIPLLGLQS